MKRAAPTPTLRQPSAWLLAASGVVLYAWAPTLVLGGHLQEPSGLAGWLPWVAPPLLYGVILAGVPGVPMRRGLAGMAVLCGIHAVLALAAPPLSAALGLVASAPLSSLWAFPAVPIIQLFAVPLVAFPLRDFLVRPRRRSGRGAVPRRMPTPSPFREGRGWDDLGAQTAGGERLRQATPAPVVTPEWRRPRREPTRPPAPPVEPVKPVRLVEPIELAEPAPPPAPAAPEALRVEVAEPLTPIFAPLIPAVPRPVPPVEEPVVPPSPPRPPSAPREPAPLPVLAAPEPPAPPEPAPEPPRPRLGAGDIARVLAPVGGLEVDGQALMGVTLFTACPPRLARDAVVNAAFRFLSFLAESADAHAVSQTTLRGSAGAMVLTPLGPLSAGGPVLAAAIPRRGALALLEILSLRVAAEYRAAQAGLRPPGGAPVAPEAPVPGFREAPAPPRMDALARSLAGAGALRPACLEDPTGRLLLYLLLAPDADPQRLGRFASDLYRVMEIEGEPGGVGPFQSVVVRLGSQRVVVRPVTASAGRSTLLVAATAGDARPGLAQLQLERVAARLATPSG